MILAPYFLIGNQNDIERKKKIIGFDPLIAVCA